MSEPRFIVAEISGFPITAASGGGRGGRVQTSAPISVSVLDTAYSHREIARWDEKRRGSSNRPGPTLSACEARQRAHAEARRLNDWDAHTDAPLDFPRLKGQGFDD